MNKVISKNVPQREQGSVLTTMFFAEESRNRDNNWHAIGSGCDSLSVCSDRLRANRMLVLISTSQVFPRTVIVKAP